MATVEIIVEATQLMRNLGQLPDIIEEESQDTLDVLGSYLVKRVQDKTPVWKGNLRDSMDHTTDKELDGWTLIIASDGSIKEVVVASVTHGTKPHWPPWFPGSSLAEWSIDHGLTPFLVARAIARRGTIARFGGPSKGPEMFEETRKEESSYIIRQFEDMLESIVKRIF